MFTTTVADEAWIAAALLQRNQPDQDFSVKAIWEKATELGFTRPGVKVHILQHAVANRPPNPGRYRMLVETARGRRRLFRPGDSYDPRREGSKTEPRPEDLPQRWQELLQWYDHWKREPHSQHDPLLSLWRSGKDLWADEPADQYVHRLREGWS